MNSKLLRNNEEAAEALIEAFRRANLNRPPDFAEECAMSDKAIAYALNEAVPQERAEIKEHLINCRECIDLYFDVRMSKKQVEESSQHPISMSAELRAAIQKSSAFASVSIFQKITAAVSRYLSFLATPQGFSAATASLIMVSLVLYYSLVIQGPLTAHIAMTAKPMTVRSASSQAAPYTIHAGDTLITGEQFQVKITANKDVYGYIILAGGSGRIKTLYSGELKADEALVIPGTEAWEKLDYRSGTEMIYLIAKKDPIQGFDEKIRALKTVNQKNIKGLFPDASLHGFGFEHE